MTLHFGSVGTARENFKAILDAADAGRVVSVERNARRSAVLDAERLRAFFAATVAPDADIRFEDGAWTVALRGRPIAAEAGTYDDALAETVDALREYADDWNEHLAGAPNHEANWGLVQLVTYSTDEQLLEWLTGSGGE